MDPAKPYSNMNFKTPLHELGLTIEGEDSEIGSFENDAYETTLVESKDSKTGACKTPPVVGGTLPAGPTPLHELGLVMEGQDYETGNLQYDAFQPYVSFQGETENFNNGAFQPNFSFQRELENFHIDPFQPNIAFQKEAEILQIDSLIQPNISFQNEAEILQNYAFQPNLTIMMDDEHLKNVSQPNLSFQRECETVEGTNKPDKVTASKPKELETASEPRERETTSEPKERETTSEPRERETTSEPRERETASELGERETASEVKEGKTASETREGDPGLDADTSIMTALDITPEQSRGVLKVIKKEGIGDEVPGYGDKVAIHYDSYLINGGQTLLFETNRNDDLREFSLGRGEVIKGWDLAVSTMKKGESALFIIDPTYGYGYGNIEYPPGIPPHTPMLFQIDLYDWKPEDLSPKKDCSILRKMLKKGEGSTFPNEGSKVKIHLLGRYQGQVFEECETEFVLGEGCCESIPEGIEIALYKFHLKEKSLIYLKDKYGLDAEVKGYGIPPKAPVSYEVTLLSFEKVKDVWEMNSDEKYEKAKVSRERGIEFTKANNFKIALRHFKWIIACLEKEPGVDPATVESRNSLLLSGYLNIALCYLKLNNYKETINFCDKALKMEPNNEKALFRKGKAKMGNNDNEEALQDFNTICKLYPENKAAKQYILSCLERIKRQEIKDKRVYNKMFDKFVKQDQERMKNMKTETGVWQNENGEETEPQYKSETERLIEQNDSLLRDANIIELSNNACAKF